jgi:tetratricopeptide (TPR) repeat protein
LLLNAQTFDLGDYAVKSAYAQFKAKQVVPPSPDAANLGKFGNVPVSLFTGSPQVSIPLVGLSARYPLNISLTYNNNGFKPGEPASWVGLGWTLNAGGVITRSALGNPDLQENYFSKSPIVLPPNSELFARYDIINDMRRGELETQPDVYYFNVGKLSGKFYIRQDGTIAKKTRDNIKISAGSTDAQLDPRLGEAYSALQSGRLDSARQLYGDVVRSDPKNIQALLGAAAVAMQQNGADEASRLYFRVLDLEPRNAYAQAGIVALMGRADPAAAEAKLKQLIAREPLASLHFTLGNLYGDQSRWAEAQQSYFQAHHLEPGNPDYAYNLAVGLEHVGQAKLASGYYRRAVELAQARGRAGFNLNQAQDRIRQLAAQPE